MTNPFFRDWDGPFALPPFDQICQEDLEPAIEAGLAEARSQVAAIAANPDTPSFENTVAALQRADRRLSQVLPVVMTLAATDSTQEREALMRRIAPRLAAFSAEINTNPAIFARLEALWSRRDDLALDAESERLLMLTRRDMMRAGASLTVQSKTRLKEIRGRLAGLSTAFTQNVLADERSWHLELFDVDLEALPPFLVEAARAAGRERGIGAPVVTLSRSLIVPFLQYSPRRDLRARAHAAWTARGARGGVTDNRAIAAEILALRAERARLLGYSDFAAFKLETEMAGSPAAVRELLRAVWRPALARAEADARMLTRRLRADGISGPLQPWDWRYYAEKRRQAELDLDEAEVRPYFQLDRMIAAAFDCAGRLFDLHFRPVEVNLHHPDARAWEVSRGDRHVAVFIGDYFARPGKRSGAWCSALRGQSNFDGRVRPVVVNVCNFARPAPGNPALLSPDDARTLFHEFGHALHQILSNVRYPAIAGTSVARDFVELPSQLFEHWLGVPEVLSHFARHAATGAAMPGALAAKLRAAARFDQGFATVEYLASALVDLALHDGPPPADVMAKQAEILRQIGMPRAIGMRHACPHFAHVFGGEGYSAGYYSYVWAEVMDADAFEAFAEAGGPFDRGVAGRLERHILSLGGSAEARELYTAFRGRMPGIEPLLRNRGLDAAPPPRPVSRAAPG